MPCYFVLEIPTYKMQHIFIIKDVIIHFLNIFSCKHYSSRISGLNFPFIIKSSKESKEIGAMQEQFYSAILYSKIRTQVKGQGGSIGVKMLPFIWLNPVWSSAQHMVPWTLPVSNSHPLPQGKKNRRVQVNFTFYFILQNIENHVIYINKNLKIFVFRIWEVLVMFRSYSFCLFICFFSPHP